MPKADGKSFMNELDPKRNAKEILFACVTDNKEVYLNQALRLVKSLRWFGGTQAQADIILCAVNGINKYYETLFKDLGVVIKVSPEFHPKNPYANKIRIFEQDEIYQYKTLILLDCDTVILQDPFLFFDGKFRARIAPVPSITSKTLVQLCKRFKIHSPKPIYTNTFTRTETVWYCNSGVLIFPEEAISKIVPRWRKYQNIITDDPILNSACGLHSNQASLALAYIENPIPFNPLPFSMNFQTHHDDLPVTDEVLETDPVIVHYHQRFNEDGSIMSTPYPLANKRIQVFNEYLSKDKVRITLKTSAVITSSIKAPAPFIVGSGRSGTNLLRMMLDSHPQMAVLPETHFIPDAVRAAQLNKQNPGDAFFDAIRQHQRWSDFRLDETELREHIIKIKPFDLATALRVFYRTYANRFDKLLWGDHTPAYAYQVDLIKGILPEAHFIHLLRDGRDVVLSYRGLWFAPNADFKIASQWLSRTLYAQQAIKHKHYLQIRYERLITDPQETLRRICGFLRLDWDPAMLEYFERTPERIQDFRHDVYKSGTNELIVNADDRMHIYKNLDRPPDMSRLNRWKREMSLWQLYRVEKTIGTELANQGYAPLGLAMPAKTIKRLIKNLISVAYFPMIAKNMAVRIFRK